MTAFLFHGEIEADGFAPIIGVNLSPETLAPEARSQGVMTPVWPPADPPDRPAVAAYVNPETGEIVWRDDPESDSTSGNE